MTMSRKFYRAVKRLRNSAFRKLSHGDLIKKLLTEDIDALKKKSAVFVETGCGISTISLTEVGKKIGATVYSCDYNSKKADELKLAMPDQISGVNFMIGDSLESLAKVAERHAEIDFLFLDSAASAMHTFKEFLIMEKCLHPGSRVLVDNAAIPGVKRVLSPVRKGKILVPYLLASPFWEVKGYPEAGDSMVAAIMRSQADYADPDYEDPEYIDNWRALFKKKLS